MSTDNEDETSDDAGRVTPHERRQWILDRLEETDFIATKDLSGEFGLTEMSLRRDLNALAEEGLIARVRGGATRARTQHTPRRYLDLRQQHIQEKTRIARAAVQLFDSARTAFFYSGTTVARVAETLTEERRATLTVVTPSLPVINTVSSWTDPQLVAVGGLYLPTYLAFVGPQAVESLRAISADVAIVGCDGLSAAEGLTTPHQLIAEIGTVIIERASQTIVVADSSKIGRHGFTTIAPISAVDILITDDNADPSELAAFRDAGVNIHIA
jgi:DeoR/GlpR family transcriptional regulator of sugar metabolism